MTAAERRPAVREGPAAGLHRFVRRHRGPVSALFAAAAVVAALSALAPPSPPRVAVLAAARELPAGGVLARRDVTTVRLPPDAVPAGVLRPGDRVVGRALAGPVRRGEPLTDVRLAGAGLLAGLGGGGGAASTGLVAAPVRIADAGAAALVRPGDRVDVIATPPDGAGPAAVVADGVLVLAAPRPRATGVEEGALLVVATSRDLAAELARAAVGDRLSLTLRG